MGQRTYKNIGIILAWNCADFVEAIYKRVPKESFDEIILVDDGSTDDTMEVARRLGIKSFTHEHSGYGGNIKFGIQKALELGAEYMVEIHGDDQYDPSFIPRALDVMRQGADFLLGSRFVDIHQPLRDSMPLSRYLANIGLSFFDRIVLQVPLTEFHSGFRVYSRTLIETVGLDHTSDDHLFSFQIIAKARYCNLRIKEISIRCNYAQEHSSISIVRSVVYSLQTFGVLFFYVVAKMGFKIKIFRCIPCERVAD